MAVKQRQTDDRECLERTREVVSAAAALLSDDNLAVPADADLDAGDSALAFARAALAGWLADHPGQPAETRGAALMLDSVAAQANVKDALLQRRADVATGAREAVSALRNAPSASALAERAPIEVRRIGFHRALFSRIEQGTWLARSGFAIDDPEFGGALVEVGRAHPRRLNGPLLESEMVRRGSPMVISDAQTNPRVHAEFIRFTGTTSYVAAPVLAWGEPVAMIHADRDVDSEVDEFDRCILGTYAEGLGLAIERAQLMERLQAVRRVTSDYMAGVRAIADDFTVDVVDTAALGLEPAGEPVRLAALIDERGEHLTAREWDVLRNLASGKTNAQIATGLFVTEGTVKSHVKHILRKLGATNRTEAVARYHRMISTSGANAG
ncbi:LuxR C-terminal-related transcriptional regulator [Mycobacterium sp. CVI_P3]|uniref:LuxR C-terminal-related transcriptional regulator n=1 Tax=Mycobacterium pinniadriaticum TaxID=2994102 RepID=A0ABT3SGY5_9MYCO|nr:LuxR C-terminal-related transcriptional regulator [Mycobacterium pinniadriaticum]MCX2932366.1 LuxR C-terminal-related transcriptional regulator [Mycobacterium pinniadriaticum]MCX2938777.1 LuxR C-terminal-related transcriptional regulator [Mycobacterium pinniadriaticum]